jgi:hypothetical protein
MSSQNEAHGDEDWKDADTVHLERALEEVVETIMDYGMWPMPRNGKFTRSQFDLYEWLQENRDPSFMLEMYVAALSGHQLEERIDRERKEITDRLTAHLRGSEIVQTLSDEINAEWNEA